MSTDPESVRTRVVGHLHLDDAAGTAISVNHVYTPDSAGTGHDPGMVGLLMKDDHGHIGALLSPGRALALANRLTRAANLVMESGEGLADVEREAARLGGQQGGAEAG